MKSQGILIYVLRVDWLIDSIYIHKKMKEEDYQIRTFKSVVASSTSLEDKQNSMAGNSISYNSLDINRAMDMSLVSRKSISNFNTQNLPKIHQIHPAKNLKVLKQL